MAEYIDREAFKRKLIDEKNFFPAIVARALDEIPAADVVPKSEAESWLIVLNTVMEEIPEMKRNVAREIFGEIDNLFDKYPTLRNIGGATIAELKKKYIGEPK